MTGRPMSRASGMMPDVATSRAKPKSAPAKIPPPAAVPPNPPNPPPVAPAPPRPPAPPTAALSLTFD